MMQRDGLPEYQLRQLKKIEWLLMTQDIDSTARQGFNNKGCAFNSISFSLKIFERFLIKNGDNCGFNFLSDVSSD